MMKTIASAAAAGLLLMTLSDGANAQAARFDPGLSGSTAMPLTTVQMGGPNMPRGQFFQGRTGIGNRGDVQFRPRNGGGGFGGRRGGFRGGGYNGGGYHGGGYRRHGGFGIGAGVAGLAAGALIGGAIASQATPAYGYGYDPYGFDAGVEPQAAYVDPGQGGGDAAYCAQRFKSYDLSSGTYLGYDGLRHPCP